MGMDLTHIYRVSPASKALGDYGVALFHGTVERVDAAVRVNRPANDLPPLFLPYWSGWARKAIVVHRDHCETLSQLDGLTFTRLLPGHMPEVPLAEYAAKKRVPRRRLDLAEGEPEGLLQSFPNSDRAIDAASRLLLLHTPWQIAFQRSGEDLVLPRSAYPGGDLLCRENAGLFLTERGMRLLAPFLPTDWFRIEEHRVVDA